MPPFLHTATTSLLEHAARLVMAANVALAGLVVLAQYEVSRWLILAVYVVAGASTALATGLVTLAAGYCHAWRVHVAQSANATGTGVDAL